MKALLNFATVYAYLSLLAKAILNHLLILIVYIFSAGPIANFRTGQNPVYNKNQRRSCGYFFYFM